MLPSRRQVDAEEGSRRTIAIRVSTDAEGLAGRVRASAVSVVSLSLFSALLHAWWTASDEPSAKLVGGAVTFDLLLVAAVLSSLVGLAADVGVLPRLTVRRTRHDGLIMRARWSTLANRMPVRGLLEVSSETLNAEALATHGAPRARFTIEEPW